MTKTFSKKVVGGRPPQYAPASLLPLWVPKRLAPSSRPRLQSADRNVSHGLYVPTLTAAAAWRVTAVIKAAWWPWLLTFWPWKWRPSHAWWGPPLCQF